MKCYVLYEGGWPCGVYRTMRELAEAAGVTESTANCYASSSYKSRPNALRLVEKVELP